FVIEFVRSTPLLVQMYFLFSVLPLTGAQMSPLTTGIVALGLHYAAYCAEVYRAGIEAVPRGQWEAATALNMSRWRTAIGVVLPQAIPPVVPALGNYLVAMFKDTPLLSAITVVELLQQSKMIGSATFRYTEPLTLVGLLFLALSLVAAWGVRGLEARLQRYGGKR
ncbi:MAG: ectoine/hydroxyectoine ABC transporter permease subunit EhuD, partial [Achromobacter marplatensis]|uniref:ectoine/hydroxyectoine ABC transporter permease subunit EhuD n=1 Tax=Achromobacter marplatensis TaxID=470868 RepID=UPI003D03E789